jgi:hypothetical protein
MSKFLGSLLTRSLYPKEIEDLGMDPAVQLYELRDDFAYRSDKLGLTIIVPAGLITNFASIPRVVQNILPNNHPFIEMPSVPHDFVYGLKGQLPDGTVLTREQADDMIREGMEVQGAPGWIRHSVYWTLRLFGQKAWDAARIDR